LETPSRFTFISARKRNIRFKTCDSSRNRYAIG